MFTGIVEELGTVVSREGAKLRIAATRVLDGVGLGDSTAVNGCCLTVVAWQDPDGDTPGWWEADVSDETYRRTSLGDLQPGDPVNLERPVRLMDRLGGHLVQGHVDGVGTVVQEVPDLVVELPEGLARYVVEKGSITVDGVSLTVVDAPSTGSPSTGDPATGTADRFSVAVIPHTAEVTTLGARPVGSSVNIEVDVTAKYIERLAAPYLSQSAAQHDPKDQP